MAEEVVEVVDMHGNQIQLGDLLTFDSGDAERYGTTPRENWETRPVYIVCHGKLGQLCGRGIHIELYAYQSRFKHTVRIENRLPLVGETVYWWQFPHNFEETVLSGEVIEVNPAGSKGLAYSSVRVAVGKDGITSLHGVNPAIKGDRDSWFFTERSCRCYARSIIEYRRSRLAENSK